MTISRPLKRHGGKHYLAKRIVGLMPNHEHYVEPYFGAGSVLFAKEFEGTSEVINDADGELANFWKVMADDKRFWKFSKLADATGFDENLWCDSAPKAGRLPVERARAFFVRCRQSRQAAGKDFATPVQRIRRGMNDHVSAYLSAVDDLPWHHERLLRVAIYSREARDVIRQNDGARTLFYLDPPYMHPTRNCVDSYGAQEMSDSDHEALLQTLVDLQGKFILSGYRTAMYDRYANTLEWNRVDIEVDNKASGRKVKPRMVESLWMNY